MSGSRRRCAASVARVERIICVCARTYPHTRIPLACSRQYSYIMRETERAALATAALAAPAPVVLACMHNQMMVDRMGGSFGKRQQCAADLELSAKRHRG